MIAAEPVAAAGPNEPWSWAVVEPFATLNSEVNVVADAAEVAYVLVCVIPADAEIFSPSAKTTVSLSVPVFS